MPESREASATVRRSSTGTNVRRGLMNYLGVGTVLIALIIYFGVTQAPFFTIDNFLLILEGNAVLLVVSLGLTFVLLTGQFDLSIGGMLVLSGVVMALLIKHGVPTPVAILICIVGGILFGAFVNGALIAILGLSFFVVTLGTLTALRGVASLSTKGLTQDLYTNSDLRTLGSGSIHGVPYLVIIAVGLMLIALFVTRYTGFGRQLYAIGGNPEAARISGINVRATRIIVFAIAGGMAALAGCLDAARLGAAAPDAQLGIELTAAAAVLLGGTSFHGGSGGMFATFLGVAFLGVLANGLTISGVSSFYTPIITGVVLVAAVAVDQLREKAVLHKMLTSHRAEPDQDIVGKAPAGE